MRFLSAALVSLMAFSSLPTDANGEVQQRRATGAYMNSLYDRVPPMMKLLTEANGEQFFAAQGSYGVQPPAAPNWDQNWIRFGVPSTGAGNSWPAVDRANVTDIFMVTDNFSGPPAYTSQGPDPDPSVGGPIPWGVAEGQSTVWAGMFTVVVSSHEENTSGRPNYWIYEGWSDGGKLFDEATGAGSSRDFAAWRERTTTQFNYTGWFDNLVQRVRENVPDAASRIKLIPVARTMVSVMENTPASALSADDWFADDAPHGHDTLHLLAAMIVYSTIFEETAPRPDVSGLDVNGVFMDNYDEIASHVFEVVAPYIGS